MSRFGLAFRSPSVEGQTKTPVSHRDWRGFCRSQRLLSRCVVKLDVDAVSRMLSRGRYVYGMASFTLDGETFEYLKPDPGHQPEDAKSWTYGKYPKVLASLPLADGGTVTVYAAAERWNPSHILVSWADDGRHAHWAWVPAGNVERVTDSEWDIEEYRRCPEHLRGIRWGHRLPGFLPA